VSRARVVLFLVAGFACAAPAATAGAATPEGSDSGCAKLSASGTRQQWRCRYGPVTLGAYQVRQETMIGGVPKPPVSGSIVAMSTNVTERDGTPVPIQRLMLHHIVFGTIGRQDSTCKNFTMWDSETNVPALSDRFYGAGEERARLLLPRGYGYPYTAGGSWSMVWMFMNHRNQTDSAYISYDVTIDTAPGITPVKPYWLDVKNCLADPVYDVPGGRRKGSTSTKSWDYVMPESGRIVAGGGHVHGGAKRLTLTEPNCSNRQIARSEPMWGLPSDPFYNVRPVLHEPGPISMSGFNSATGIPVAKGERLRLNSIYDNELPHTRVMGIYVVYVARDDGVKSPCGQLPSDQLYGWWRTDGRRSTPRFRVPLIGRNAAGKAVRINKPLGSTKKYSRSATVKVNGLFQRNNVSIPLGSKVTWRFDGQPIADPYRMGNLHNVTLANGPLGFSSPNLDGGRSFTKRFTRPGTYRYFCAWHPVSMTGTVTVRPRARRR
jgi:plastocyanin